MPTQDPKTRAVSDTKYTKVNLEALEAELHAEPAMVVGTAGANASADGLNFTVVFKDTLDAGQEAAFDAVVADHEGEPLKVLEIVHLDAPTESDGKPVFVSSPAPEGMLTFFTGRGDDASPTPPASGRGAGTPIKLSLGSGDTYPNDALVQWEYTEPTWVHDGQLTWKSADEFDADDHFSLSVVMPANAPTVNGGNTGNCNLVATGQGYNVIVPAAGDGTHDLDLQTAVPVPAGFDKQGYWNVDERTGAITASMTPGKAEWHLLDIQVQSYFLRCIPLHNPLGVFDVDVYKVEWVSSTWKWRLDVHKEVAPTVDVSLAAWLMLYREHTT